MSDRKRRTQAERSKTSDEAMLKAAVSLVAREGLQGITLSKVGKEAGFTGGLVSYRYHTKLGLIKAVSNRLLANWSAYVIEPAMENAKGIETLATIAELYLERAKSRSDMLLAMSRLMNECHTYDPELADLFRNYDQKVRSLLVDCILSDPNSRSSNAEAAEDMVTLFLATLRGLTGQYIMDNDIERLEQSKSLMVAYCEKSLKAH